MSSPVVNTTSTYSIQQGESVQLPGQPSCPADPPIRLFVGSDFMITSTENNFNELCTLDADMVVETCPILIGHYQERMLTILNTCQCCDRHQINKPTVYQPWVDTTYHGTLSHLSCSCSCRHIARMICRECPT